ncbi:hypothetical protein GGQ87_002586 [Brevundimonas alba]|uniref:DUF6968 domain-containing protein n=1 Tax=Brevundimonas alba TaxID=74314 RepID=A0A7X6BQ69_9CAUL|nr:hypothetical protein [Brevundimonas alba]NJC42291.1 hypothetical protein [Brevundimonas alba]
MTSGSPVVCERIFQQIIDGKTHRFRVVWMPPVPAAIDWACEFVIEWPSRPWRSRRSSGVDSAQALLLAMKSVSGELYDAEPPVFWHEPDDILDLPILEEVRDLEAARTKGRI